MPDPDKRPGILIVDDQPIALGVLELTLKRDDYEVYSASNGESALSLAEEKSPHLIILDMTMPDVDGLDLLQSLKSNPKTEDIIVVFLSAITDAAVKTEGLRLGAVDYIQKPFNPSELRARVQAHLRLKDRLDSLRNQYQELSQKFETRASQLTGACEHGAIDLECVVTEKKKVVFKTDVGRVQGVVNQLLIGITGLLGKKARNDLALGLHEIVLNAVEHGNLGITSEAKSEALETQTFTQLVEERLAIPELARRLVEIDYEFDGKKAVYTIVDEGEGFDWTRFLERDEPEDLLASNGRGIIISRYIFDRIEYSDRGNRVRLEKTLV